MFTWEDTIPMVGKGDFYFFRSAKNKPMKVVRCYPEYTGYIGKLYYGDTEFTIHDWLTENETEASGYWAGPIETPRL